MHRVRKNPPPVWEDSILTCSVTSLRDLIIVTLVLNEDHAEFSIIRQLHLWTSLKHEPEATRQAKLSPVGPVTRDGVEYEETYLIQRLRPQRCAGRSKVCNRRVGC
jgi:hypothetical protein